MNLIIEREVNIKFSKLISLLDRTIRELLDTTRGIVFEIVSLNNKIKEVRFKA